VETQARLDAGLMSKRLPWQVTVYLFCVVIPIWFNAGPLLMSTLRLFLMVMIIPVVIRLLMGVYGRLIITDWLFIAHTVWMAVALGVMSPEAVVTQVGSVGMEFLGGYAIGRAYVRTPEVFLALCRALTLIVLCMMPFALYEAQTGRPLIVEYIARLPGIRSVEIVTTEGRLGLERVQGPFAHPIHFGLFCSVAFSLSFVALKGLVGDTRRWLTAGIVAATGFLGLASGAWLAIILQIALIAWAAAFDRIRWRWWLLVGLFALAYVAIDILSNRTPIRVFMSYATFSAHTAYWRGLIFEWGIANVLGSIEKSIPASPIFGIGLRDWIRPHFMSSGSMDNFWLVLAVRYGVPGFFLLVIGYAIVIARVMRRDFTADPVLSQIRRAWVFTFLGLTFTLCTVHIWTNVFSFTFFMFGAGVWILAAQPILATKQTVAHGHSVQPKSFRLSYSRFPVLHRRPGPSITRTSP
jgi:tetrahydromethanopterin S-methyltransferase subunit F